MQKSMVNLISDSTIHGLPKVFKSKTPILKIFWSICFLCSGCYCGYMILKTVQAYLDYQVITNIQTFSQIPAEFPLVTLCNLNQVNNNNSFELVKIQSNTDEPNIIKKFNLMNKFSEFNDSIKQSFTSDLNETLIKCLINSKNCNASDFEWIFLPFPNGGNCYQFNTGKNSMGLKKQASPGFVNGLRLELFLGNPNFTPSFFTTSGYHIIIGNKSVNIKVSDGYDVSAGMETNIILNRVYTLLKPYPYTECTDKFDSDLYRIIINSNKTYRQTECHQLCYQKLVIQKCKCYTASLDNLDSKIPCSNLTQTSCLIKVWEEFEVSDVKSICLPYCPLECDSISFQPTVTFSQYPTKSYAEAELMRNPLIKSQFNNEKIDFELIKQVVLAVNIYYDQLEYTILTQEAKTEIFDLVSNLGGLFGLFLGGSLLSCIEIIEIPIELMLILFSKIKIKN